MKSKIEKLKEKRPNLITAISKAAKGLGNALPMIFGTILLVSFLSTIIPKSLYTQLFSKNVLLDSIIGALIGSVSAGNPITSYIFGGEILSQGVSLIAITAFLVSWVTVGIIQLPAEATILGKKFALLRNLSAFILSIIVAIVTVLILGVF